MSWGIGTRGDQGMVGDSDTWGGPENSVDMIGEAGIQLGSNKWHARMTVDLWEAVIMIGALVGLWLLGGVVFRKINIW